MSGPTGPDPFNHVTAAAITMLRRTGMKDVDIAFQDETKPIAWIAVGRWEDHPAIGAGFDPHEAVMALLETTMDGGTCLHCKRPTGVTTDIDSMPAAELFCWYQYDPELKEFRRGCEGETQIHIERPASAD